MVSLVTITSSVFNRQAFKRKQSQLLFRDLLSPAYLSVEQKVAFFMPHKESFPANGTKDLLIAKKLSKYVSKKWDYFQIVFVIKNNRNYFCFSI